MIFSTKDNLKIIFVSDNDSEHLYFFYKRQSSSRTMQSGGSRENKRRAMRRYHDRHASLVTGESYSTNTTGGGIYSDELKILDFLDGWMRQHIIGSRCQAGTVEGASPHRQGGGPQAPGPPPPPSRRWRNPANGPWRIAPRAPSP